MPRGESKPKITAGHPFEHGPYVQVAAFCERVLTEADGVASLIRIVDRITHQESGPNPPQDMPTVRYPLTLVIILKSGKAKGRHELTITPELPSGETLSSVTTTVQLEGEHRGVMLVSPIDVPYTLEGLYWFHVRFGDAILTRLPLFVQYSRTVTGSTGRAQ